VAMDIGSYIIILKISYIFNVKNQSIFKL